MFCCDDKRKKQDDICYKGIVIGGIVAVASMLVVGIYKKIKCRKIEKVIEELEMEEINEQSEKEDKEYTEDQELKEKIDEFNSRRLTTENETLHERL
ncbi:hypothetical protein [Intestinibacter sp.]|uniref:hypothetical protein n=1 Tax=Intestinibacter sp. TaxID=1965304 RepID=UPI002A919CD4|nr:hypothetical protein [Intestinibacter sp.]MDY5211542.1 hypothetical protein [Intestinibacter sp.]